MWPKESASTKATTPQAAIIGSHPSSVAVGNYDVLKRQVLLEVVAFSNSA